jgi:alpha-beta hydrolase superfamily lysophospholipase
MDFDPAPVFAATRVPTLLFYGADDSWTPVQASVDAWRRARGDAVDVVVIPEASHELTLTDGGLAPEYDERLAKWLAGRLSQ